MNLQKRVSEMNLDNMSPWERGYYDGYRNIPGRSPLELELSGNPYINYLDGHFTGQLERMRERD